MADGHLNKCKSCTRSDVAENRDINKTYYLEYDRARGNLAHRVEARREYIRTDAGKAAKARASAAYDSRDPIRYKSHYIVTNAIRSGKLIKASNCEECNSAEKIEGHHDDYTKPLDVRWLCEQCHKEWHRNNTPIYGVS